ncbi:MAG: FKBP-type peptidyl-prolyl cis-trans isomerase N-terminal domain-containing protein, partial [Planctomycetota bacterium]
MRIALALLLLAVTSVRAEDALPPPAEQADPSGDPRFSEKVSYSIGLDLGRRLKRDEVECDLGAIIAGLRDALSGAEPMLTDDEIMAVMCQFEEQMQQKSEAKMAQSASDN